jgi:hypothetical protein
LQWPPDPTSQEPFTVTATTISVTVPAELSDVQVDYTIRMPGFVLEEGSLLPEGDIFEIIYDPLTLHQDFSNLDLMAKDTGRPGLTDPVLVTFLLTGKQGEVDVQRVGMVFFDGEYVWVPGKDGEWIYLPLVTK